VESMEMENQNAEAGSPQNRESICRVDPVTAAEHLEAVPPFWRLDHAASLHCFDPRPHTGGDVPSLGVLARPATLPFWRTSGTRPLMVSTGWNRDTSGAELLSKPNSALDSVSRWIASNTSVLVALRQPHDLSRTRRRQAPDAITIRNMSC